MQPLAPDVPRISKTPWVFGQLVNSRRFLSKPENLIFDIHCSLGKHLKWFDHASGELWWPLGCLAAWLHGQFLRWFTCKSKSVPTGTGRGAYYVWWVDKDIYYHKKASWKKEHYLPVLSVIICSSSTSKAWFAIVEFTLVRNRRHILTNNSHVTACGKALKSMYNLRKHMGLVHDGEKPFACRECDTRFSLKRNLTQHMLIHKLFACSNCSKSFRSKIRLSNHMIEHHEVSLDGKPTTLDRVTKSFVCPECGKMLKNKMNLKRHMIIHVGGKPFICTVCMKGFPNKSTLKNHARTHTGEKPFVCTICDNRFTTNGYLKLHIEIHNGEKLFACIQCEKMFRTNQYLIAHMRTHTGEKTYACPECEIMLSTYGSLKAHLRIHTGENTRRPFSCELCSKAFGIKRQVEQTYVDTQWWETIRLSWLYEAVPP